MSCEATRATLLALPRELRDTIYVYVLQTEVDFQASNTYWPKRFFKGGDCFCYRNDPEHSTERVKGRPLRAPWLPLMLACQQMAAEVRDIMNEGGQKDIRTYIADLHMGDFERKSAVIWKQIPCRPDHARRLTVNIFTRNLSIGGDGGFSPVVKTLYHALNTFLHFGPMLNHKRPLQNSVHLEELHVAIHCHEEPKHPYHAYFVALAKLARFGPLGGMVDIISLKDRKNESPRKFIVKRGDCDGMVPENWEAYGYGWGFKPDHIDGLAPGSIPEEVLYDFRGRVRASHDE